MRPKAVPSSEITPKALYLRRREFLEAMAALVVTKKLVTTTDAPTPLKTITTYNNFYEFGSDKGDPARNSGKFKPKPWSVAVEGACGRPGSYTLEDILKPHPL